MCWPVKPGVTRSLTTRLGWSRRHAPHQAAMCRHRTFAESGMYRISSGDRIKVPRSGQPRITSTSGRPITPFITGVEVPAA